MSIESKIDWEEQDALSTDSISERIVKRIKQDGA